MSELGISALAPILAVEAIEPCLGFWEKLGFAATVTVPDTAPFVFAIVKSGGAEVMLQTKASMQEDVPGVASLLAASVLYVSVSSLDPVIQALGDAPVLVQRRTTFYGADEVFVTEPGGHVVGFAAPAKG